MESTKIIQASTAEHFEEAAKLIHLYVQFLGEDLCFQQIDAELADLPTMYGQENGALFLAQKNEAFVGMVALRKKKEGICEMKRLYVLPSTTGLGIGKQLAEMIIRKSKEMGYKEMLLDTLQRLVPALHLYQQLDFEEIPPYYENPLPEVVFMRLKLM